MSSDFHFCYHCDVIKFALEKPGRKSTSPSCIWAYSHPRSRCLCTLDKVNYTLSIFTSGPRFSGMKNNIKLKWQPNKAGLGYKLSSLIYMLVHNDSDVATKCGRNYEKLPSGAQISWECLAQKLFKISFYLLPMQTMTAVKYIEYATDIKQN